MGRATCPRKWAPRTVAAALALGALTAPSGVWAASQLPPALHEHALSHPQDLSFHIIPRAEPSPSVRLGRRSAAPQHESLDSSTPPEWDDRFLLSFLAHDGEPVTLSLRPAAHLVPVNGVRSVERWQDAETGEWRSAERVLGRTEMRAYEGWVLPDGEDMDRWIREEMAGVVRPPRAGAGWARIVLSSSAPATAEDNDGEDDFSPLRFQGTYEKDGEHFTVQSTERYLRTKDVVDPEPPLVAPRRRSRRAFGGADNHLLAPRRPSMVIVRESATMSPRERIAALQKRGLPLPDADSLPSESTHATSCSHDTLPFNTDPANPVYAAQYPQISFANATSSWRSYLSGGAPVQPFSPADHSDLYSPNSYRYVPNDRRGSLWKRQGNDISGGSGTSSNFIGSIGDTSGCPKAAVVVFVGVASDCTYTQAYGSTDAAREQILTDFNTASALYQQSFNVSLGIVELAVMASACPSTSADVDASYPWNLPCTQSGTSGSSLGVDLNTRLSIFSQWRGDKGGSDGAGLWHLLTACQTGSEVGVAWLGQVCRVAASTSGGQTTSGTGVTAITRSEWQVIAHEIGHNFGAIHDCAAGCSLSGSCCPLSTTTCNANANYIMSPVSERNVSSFSPCSIGNICSTLSNSLNTTCLATPGAAGNPPVISLNSCGDGILSGDEECDPGSDTDDPCCDAATCRFAPGAVCDPRNSLCCTAQCQIASNGTVCRAAVDASCDTAEVCDGTSRECPVDEYKSDGTGCGDGLSCATGVCTSRDQQCRNAGASLGLTSACPTSASSTCSIICEDPSSSRSCVILDQSFRDGTSCGSGGRCRDGSCSYSSGLERAKGWYRDHLNIAIPVTIVVALVVIAILAAIVRCCCCRGRSPKKAGAFKPGKNKSHSSRYATAVPPPMSQQPMGNNGYWGGGGGPPGSYYAPPAGPPPTHPSNAYQGSFNHAPRGVLRR